MGEREGSTIRAAVTTFVQGPMQWVWRCAVDQSLQHSEVLLFLFSLICWLSEEICYDD
jgi:hypothetical protein